MISLTFDDGLDEHLDHAIPCLSEAGLFGTFYVHLTTSTVMQRRREWEYAAESGHELGGHTVFHPADKDKSWVSPGIAINNYTTDRMAVELEFSKQFLTTMDHRPDRTFAYPCSNPILGDYGLLSKAIFSVGLNRTRWPGLAEKSGIDLGNTRKHYGTIVSQHFYAARCGGLYLHTPSPEVSLIDRYQLPSAAVEGQSFDEMKRFIESSLEQGGWPILQFHGIGGGHHMDCELTSFKKLVDWLANKHGDKVVTVIDACKRLFPDGQ